MTSEKGISAVAATKIFGKLRRAMDAIGRKHPTSSHEPPGKVRIDLPRDRQKASRTGYLSIATIIRNEASHVVEWLEFHRMMGVEHVYLYDNGSTDNLSTVISPFVQDNFVTVTPWPFPWVNKGGPQGQHLAFAHALSTFGGGWRWMAMIDVDEFLFPVSDDSLVKTLLAYEDLPALAIPWTMYGSSGHQVRPSGLVIENYVERSPKLDKPKSIVNPARVSSIRSAHLFDLDAGCETAFDEQRRLIDRNSHGLDPASNVIRLNHYFTRSEQEFAAKIAHWRERGRDPSKLEALAKKIEVNAYRDEAILRFLPELKRRLSKERTSSTSAEAGDLSAVRP